MSNFYKLESRPEQHNNKRKGWLRNPGSESTQPAVLALENSRKRLARLADQEKAILLQELIAVRTSVEAALNQAGGDVSRIREVLSLAIERLNGLGIQPHELSTQGMKLNSNPLILLTLLTTLMSACTPSETGVEVARAVTNTPPTPTAPAENGDSTSQTTEPAAPPVEPTEIITPTTTLTPETSQTLEPMAPPTSPTEEVIPTATPELVMGTGGEFTPDEIARLDQMAQEAIQLRLVYGTVQLMPYSNGTEVWLQFADQSGAGSIIYRNESGKLTILSIQDAIKTAGAKPEDNVFVRLVNGQLVIQNSEGIDLYRLVDGSWKTITDVENQGTPNAPEETEAEPFPIATETTLSIEVPGTDVTVKLSIGFTQQEIDSPKGLKEIQVLREDQLPAIGRALLETYHAIWISKDIPNRSSISFDNFIELIKQGEGKILVQTNDKAGADTGVVEWGPKMVDGSVQLSVAYVIGPEQRKFALAYSPNLISAQFYIKPNNTLVLATQNQVANIPDPKVKYVVLTNKVGTLMNMPGLLVNSEDPTRNDPLVPIAEPVLSLVNEAYTKLSQLQYEDIDGKRVYDPILSID